MFCVAVAPSGLLARHLSPPPQAADHQQGQQGEPEDAGDDGDDDGLRRNWKNKIQTLRFSKQILPVESFVKT